MTLRAALSFAISVAFTTASFVQPAAAQSAATIQRTPIATQAIAPPKDVASVFVVRLDFKPGQPTGRHMHPVPVLGYVLEGDLIVKFENEPETHYAAGQSIYEPANKVVERYDNASTVKPATVIASYLAGPGETEFIKFLTGK